MRRFFRFLHKWLSIPIGIVITIICLTGAILVFQDEIEILENSSLYNINDVSESKIPLDKLVPFLNGKSAKEVASVQISPNESRTYILTMKKDSKTKYFVNQYTGTLVGSLSSENGTFKTIKNLHTSLGINDKSLGRKIIGTCTLLFVVILISGFILWVPRSGKKISSNLKITFNKGLPRTMYTLHNTLGFYACLILLLCALTGMMWSFGWYRNGILSFFKEDVQQGKKSLKKEILLPKSKDMGTMNKGGKAMYYTHWQSLFDEIDAMYNSQYQYIQISNGSVSVQVNSRSNDRYTFNKNTGQIMKTSLYEDKTSTVKVMGWVNSLHMGDYWGMWSKILTFIAALIGATLPITGYYLFYIKQRNRLKSHRK